MSDENVNFKLDIMTSVNGTRLLLNGIKQNDFEKYIEFFLKD